MRAHSGVWWRLTASLAVSVALALAFGLVGRPSGAATQHRPLGRLAHARAPGRPVGLFLLPEQRVGGTVTAVVGWHQPTYGGIVDSYEVSDGSVTCSPSVVDAPTESCALTGVPAGVTYTFTVTASNAAGSNSARLTRYIRPDGQTIDFPPLADVSFGTAPIALAATATSGLPVTYGASGACTVRGDTLVISEVGPCAVTAFQAGDQNFAAASPVANYFEVGAGRAVLSLTGGTFIYDGAGHAATASVTPPASPVVVTYCLEHDPNAACSTQAPVQPGVYRATAQLRSVDYVATGATATIVIDPKPAILPPGLGGSITSSGSGTTHLTRHGIIISSSVPGFPAGDPVDVSGVSEESVGRFVIPSSTSVAVWLNLLRASTTSSFVVDAFGVHGASAEGLSRAGSLAFPDGGFPGPGRYEIVELQSSGFVPGSTVSAVLHSAPLVLASARADASGEVTLEIPLPLAWAGQSHQLLLVGSYLSTSTTADSAGTTTATVSVSKSLLERLSPNADFVMAFVDRLQPSLAAYTVTSLPAVAAFRAFLIASTPLHLHRYKVIRHSRGAMTRITGAAAVLSAAAAGVAVARTAGGAASAARGATSAGGRGAASAHRGSAENVEALHHTHDRDRTHIGDRSFTWRFPGREAIDAMSLTAPTWLARMSPFAAMTVSDGSYWRAAFGSLSSVLPLLGAVLGALASRQTHGYPLPPHLDLFLAIVVLGFLDALAGMAASAMSLMGGLLTGHCFSLNMVISGLLLATLWWGLPVMVKKVRPFVRPHPRSRDDWWQRLGDFLVGPIFAGFLAAKLVDSFSLVSALKVGLVADGAIVGWVVAACAVARYGLVTVTVFFYPQRLAAVSPTHLPEQSQSSSYLSILIRMTFAGLIAAALLGWTWVVGVLVVVFGVSLFLRDYGLTATVPAWFYRIIPRDMGKVLAFEIVGTIATGLIARHIHSGYWQVACLLGVMIVVTLSMDMASRLKGQDWPDTWALKAAGIVMMVLVTLQLSGHLIT